MTLRKLPVLPVIGGLGSTEAPGAHPDEAEGAGRARDDFYDGLAREGMKPLPEAGPSDSEAEAKVNLDDSIADAQVCKCGHPKLVHTGGMFGSCMACTNCYSFDPR